MFLCLYLLQERCLLGVLLKLLTRKTQEILASVLTGDSDSHVLLCWLLLLIGLFLVNFLPIKHLNEIVVI